MKTETKNVALFKNIKYGFTTVFEIDDRDDGLVLCGFGNSEYIAVSNPLHCVFEMVDTVEAELNALEELEKKTREEALKELDRAINAIKDRRAALISLMHIQGD